MSDRGLPDLTDYEVTRIFELRDSLSAGKLAKAFGLKSRNVVIGFWRRATSADTLAEFLATRRRSPNPKPLGGEKPVDDQTKAVEALFEAAAAKRRVNRNLTGPRPGSRIRPRPQGAVHPIRALIADKKPEDFTKTSRLARQMAAEACPSAEEALSIHGGQCRWPLDGRFCRKQTYPASPYCREHTRIAYTPARQIRKETVDWLAA